MREGGKGKVKEVVTVVRLGKSSDDGAEAPAAAEPASAPPVERTLPSPSSAPTSSSWAAAAGEHAAAAIAVLVPFREDGTGRGRQLSALIDRLALLFPVPGQCVVVVAEQSADERRFNRGQLLNAAFLHLRDTRPEWCDADTLYCFHDCDMLPAPSLASHYLRPLAGDDALTSAPAVRVLQAGGSRYDGEACFGEAEERNRERMGGGGRPPPPPCLCIFFFLDFFFLVF